MYAVITITNPGGDLTGPFNIYSDIDNYVSAFESNISLSDLLAGFATFNVPVGTEIIRVQTSFLLVDACNVFIDTNITTTTTTTTV